MQERKWLIVCDVGFVPYGWEVLYGMKTKEEMGKCVTLRKLRVVVPCVAYGGSMFYEH